MSSVQPARPNPLGTMVSESDAWSDRTNSRLAQLSPPTNSLSSETAPSSLISLSRSVSIRPSRTLSKNWSEISRGSFSSALVHSFLSSHVRS